MLPTSTIIYLQFHPQIPLVPEGYQQKIIHGQMRKVKGPEKSPVHAPGILEFSIIWTCGIWKVEDSSYHGHTMSFMTTDS